MSAANTSHDDKSGAAVSTGVDALLELISKEGKMSFSKAAKKLKVSEDVIEAWANFLEETHDVVISYQMTTPYISLGEKKEQKATTVVEAPGKELEKKISTLLDSIDSFYSTAGSLLERKEFNTFMNMFKRMRTTYAALIANLKREGKKREVEELERKLAQIDNAVAQGSKSLAERQQEEASATFERALQDFYSTRKDVLSIARADPSVPTKKRTKETHEHLLEEARDAIKRGDLKRAQYLYEQLNEVYAQELPKRFEEQRESIKKELFHLGKDITFAREGELKEEFERTQKTIDEEFSEAYKDLANKEFTSLREHIGKITELFNNLPVGFELEKKAIQDKLLALMKRQTEEKKRAITRTVEEARKTISTLHESFTARISSRDYHGAKEVFAQMKQHYTSVPHELLPEKIDVYTQMLDDFKTLTTLYKELFEEQNHNRIDHVHNLISRMKSEVESDRLDAADKTYNNIQTRLREIADYYYEQKAELQMHVIGVYKTFLDKSYHSYRGEFSKVSDELMHLIEAGERYVQNLEYDLAEETYVRALREYGNLKPGFSEEKKRLRNALFAFYSKLVLMKDLKSIEQHAPKVHEAYHTLLSLIIDAHHAIALNKLDLLPNAMARIFATAKDVPREYWQKTASIVNELKKLKAEHDLYEQAHALEAQLSTGSSASEKDIEHLRQILSYVERTVPEDSNLIDYASDVLERLTNTTAQENAPAPIDSTEALPLDIFTPQPSAQDAPPRVVFSPKENAEESEDDEQDTNAQTKSDIQRPDTPPPLFEYHEHDDDTQDAGEDVEANRVFLTEHREETKPPAKRFASFLSSRFTHKKEERTSQEASVKREETSTDDLRAEEPHSDLPEAIDKTSDGTNEQSQELLRMLEDAIAEKGGTEPTKDLPKPPNEHERIKGRIARLKHMISSK